MVRATAARRSRWRRGAAARARVRFTFKKKVVKFCTQKLKIDYKDADGLRRFTTSGGARSFPGASPAPARSTSANSRST
jgi:hypothetical protein